MLFAICACHAHSTDSKYDGIWEMDDISKMSSFLNVKEKIIGDNYDLDLNLNRGKAKIRFIYSKNEYTVDVKKISDNNYQMMCNGKTRSFSFSFSNYDNNLVYYWHFADSSPTDENGARDGIKLRYYNKSLDESIKQLQADYELSQIEKEAPPQ